MTPAVSGRPRLAREDQPLRPVALLGQQDPPEPRKPHEHRRQDGADGELDHQRRQQELLGGQEAARGPCMIYVCSLIGRVN